KAADATTTTTRHQHANGFIPGHTPIPVAHAAAAEAPIVDDGEDQLLPPLMEDAVPPDWTDWMRLRAFLWLSILRLVDSTFSLVINGAVLTVAIWVGFAGYLFIGPLMQLFRPWLSRPIKIKELSENGSTLTQPSRMFYRSAMSAAVPGFHEEYTDVICKPGALQSIGVYLSRRIEDRKRPPFSTDAARFFVHLNALSYENREIVFSFARDWGLGVEAIETDYCAANIFYSIEHSFVVVAVRGVGTLDLSEFIMGAILQKSKPSEDVLPGYIHEPFLNLLSFPTEPDSIVEIAVNENKNTIDVNELLQTLREVVFPRMRSHAPAVWFTGHGAGGSLASLIVSHFIYTNSSLITSSALRGCYTFGAPKCGDTEFATTIAKLCNAAQ
ncbi:hypothetical protein HK405_010047, partial [Cladochytrium tenue]